MAQRQYGYHPGCEDSYLRPHTERRLGQISKRGLLSPCPGQYQKPQYFIKDQKQSFNKACDASERKTKDIDESIDCGARAQTRTLPKLGKHGTSEILSSKQKILRLSSNNSKG